MADENFVNRLSIQVPDYDTRMNLGTPDPGVPSGAQPFGYTGFGVHTAFNFFVDVGRVGFYQSNLGSCWQVGGKWLQWSNQDMYMATQGNNTLAADNKVLIASGAGMGQVTILTSANAQFESPRMVEYNNLALHWRVDGVRTALNEFLYGKDKWQSAASTSKDLQANYSTSDSAGAPTKHYPGGFLKDVDDFLTTVDRQVMKRGLLRGFEWEGDRYDMSNGLSKSSSYSAIDPFDPYPPSQFTDNFLSYAYAITVQVLNWMHRTVDMLRKAVYAITDNFVLKRAQMLIQAWGDAQDMVYNYLSAKQDFDQWERRGGEDDVFSGHLPTGDGGIGRDHRPGASYFVIHASPAKLFSQPGPWDVSGESALTFTINDGSTTVTVTVTGPIVTAAALAAAISAAAPSTCTASVEDGVVVITRNPPGSSSTITVDGPLAPVFFGEDTSAQGTDESTFGADGIDNERSIEISFSSLPEDVRDDFRPLYSAAQDWLGVVDKAVNVIGDLTQAVIGQISPPSMLGLVAKDGITLATAAPMVGTGGGITLIATGKGGANATGPDQRKFVPLEQLVKSALDEDDPAKAALQSVFVPDSDLRGDALPGNFRVAAQADVVVTAAGQMLHVSLADTAILSNKTFTAVSSKELVIRSYNKSAEILGTQVRIGSPHDSGKQLATKTINVAGSDRIDLRTDKLRTYLGDGKVLVGKNDKDKAFVDTKSPHLHIDPEARLLAGYFSGSDFFGLDVEQGGSTVITGSTAVSLGLKSGPGIEIGTDGSSSSSTVLVHGDLKVGGSSFSVKGSTTFSPSAPTAPTAPTAPSPATDTTSLQGQYNAILTQARTKNATLDAPRPPGLPDEALTAFTASQTAARDSLRELYPQHLDLVEQARSKEIIPEDIGWSAAVEDLFGRRSPDGG